MTSHTLSRHASLFLLGELVEAGGRQFRKTVVISLLLHLCLLVGIAGTGWQILRGLYRLKLGSG